jgi:hypothetical protein
VSTVLETKEAVRLIWVTYAVLGWTCSSGGNTYCSHLYAVVRKSLLDCRALCKHQYGQCDTIFCDLLKDSVSRLDNKTVNGWVVSEFKKVFRSVPTLI